MITASSHHKNVHLLLNILLSYSRFLKAHVPNGCNITHFNLQHTMCIFSINIEFFLLHPCRSDKKALDFSPYFSVTKAGYQQAAKHESALFLFQSVIFTSAEEQKAREDHEREGGHVSVQICSPGLNKDLEPEKVFRKRN